MYIKKKLIFFLAMISLFYCVSLIQSTYAKYVTAATGTTNLTIARWNIVVNDQDVTNNSNFSSTIQPVLNASTNIKNGVLAPTSTGYFDIILDMADVDVSLEYTISVGSSGDNTVDDLRVTSYSINGVTSTYTSSLTDQLLISETTRTKTIRFYFEWYEGPGEIMDNADDTEATIDGIANIDATITFTQIR